MTPGQINYEAWFQAAGLRRIVPWAQLRPCGQAAWETAAQAVLAHTIPQSFAEKTALNTWAAARYDALIHEGKHGHYETMFRVIQEALKRHHPTTKETP
jgi:hypothetical protein